MRLRISDKGTPRLYLNVWLTNKETLMNQQHLNASELGRITGAVTFMKYAQGQVEQGGVDVRTSNQPGEVETYRDLGDAPPGSNRRVYPAEIAKAKSREMWRIQDQTGQSAHPFQIEDDKLRLTPNQGLLLTLTGHGSSWPDKPWQPWEGAKIYKGDYEYSPAYPPPGWGNR